MIYYYSFIIIFYYIFIGTSGLYFCLLWPVSSVCKFITMVTYRAILLYNTVVVLTWHVTFMDAFAFYTWLYFVYLFVHLCQLTQHKDTFLVDVVKSCTTLIFNWKNYIQAVHQPSLPFLYICCQGDLQHLPRSQLIISFLLFPYGEKCMSKIDSKEQRNKHLVKKNGSFNLAILLSISNIFYTCSIYNVHI